MHNHGQSAGGALTAQMFSF